MRDKAGGRRLGQRVLGCYCDELFGEMGTTGRQANCSWQQRRKGGGVMVFFWFRSGRGCDPGLPLCRGGLPLCGCASCAFCALSWSCGGGAGNGELAGLEEQPKWKREVRIKGVIQYVMR